MQNGKLSRRDLLKLIGASSATMALAACAAPGGGAAPSAGGDAAPDGELAQMTIATFAAELHDWQREFASRWAEEHADEVDLQIEEVVYGEMSKLQLARQASGTLWDLVFSGIKWYPFSASKGMFLALDDYVDANPEAANLEDFFAAALDGGYVDGTLYGLPYEIHPGNPALVAVNMDALDAAGLEAPTNDWDVNQFAEMAAALTDADNNVWGTDYFPGNYYDFQSLVRAYEAEIMDDGRDQFLFNVNESNREAAQWIFDLRNELNAAVPQTQAGVEGIEFTAEAVLMDVTGSYSVNGYATTIGDSFNYEWYLFPKGPEGSRGYTAFTSNFSVAEQTSHPDLATDLLFYLSSEEAGTWSALEQGTGQPNARVSVWSNEDLLEQSHPIFRTVLEEYFTNPAIDGSFPMPSNLRFQELQDNWANTSPELFYGDVEFEEGMENVQENCQDVMDLPRA